MDPRIMNSLPPAAAERVRRQADSHVAGSLLSAPAHAALAAADLVPVGEVMGCIVMHLGWSGSGCGGGYYSMQGSGPSGFNLSYVTPILTSGDHRGQSWLGYGPYIKARYHAYDTALNRMLAEARALNADGVIGVQLRWTQLDSGAHELMALGTAVRDRRVDRAQPRPGWPYCTELNGEDVAKAVLSGWTPLGIAIGLALAVKHHDWQLDQQTSWFQGAGNTEVDGLTKLMHAARRDARNQLTRRAQSFTGAAQIVVSSTTLRVSERVCSNNQEDHLAEAGFTGTVLAHHPDHRRREPASSLTILPLRGTTRNPRGGMTL